MSRQARLDSPGTLHHVMVRGIEQRQITDDEKDRADFVRRLAAWLRNRHADLSWALPQIVSRDVRPKNSPIEAQ